MQTYLYVIVFLVGGAVALWLARSTPERAVRVRVLAGKIVLCSWARHLPLTVPLSTQVYKSVPASFWGNLTDCGEVTCDGLLEILLAASCYRNRDKLRNRYASHGFKASLFYVIVFRSKCPGPFMEAPWPSGKGGGREVNPSSEHEPCL